MDTLQGVDPSPLTHLKQPVSRRHYRVTVRRLPMLDKDRQPMIQLKIGCALVLSTLTALVVTDSTYGEEPIQIESQSSQLNKANFTQWRDLIRTTDSELAWQQLPWTPSFHDGLAQAAKLNKPLLLWVMNGHPMGCT